MRARASTTVVSPVRQRVVDWRLLERWLRSRSLPPPHPLTEDGLDEAPAAPAAARPHLINACVASGFEVALQAEALAAGLERLDAAPVDLAAVLDEVAAVLRPLAESGGVRLLREGAPAGVEHRHADARRLHSVLFHLIVRALAVESPGGHVRVSASWCAGEACVRILSRVPEPAVDPATPAEARDLTAARYMLSTMGGALLLEPRRAGYQPLCMVLRTPPRAAALRVA